MRASSQFDCILSDTLPVILENAGLSWVTALSQLQNKGSPSPHTTHSTSRGTQNEEGTAACLAQGMALKYFGVQKRGGRKKGRGNTPQKSRNNYFWSAQTASTNRCKQTVSLLQGKQKLYVILTILIMKLLKGSWSPLALLSIKIKPKTYTGTK